MTNKSKPSFKPLPGWIITKPYLPKDQTFVPGKESAGEAQQSEVIAVGGSYKDDHGNLRVMNLKKGDVILHFYAQQTYEVGFDKYRAVPFSQVIGKL